MQDFFDLLKEVWATGFLGIDLGSLISSLLVLLVAFLFRGFIISVILNALGRLAESTESKIDDEILNALRRPIGLVPVTIALYICTLILPLSGLIGDIATNVVKAFVIFTTVSFLSGTLSNFFNKSNKAGLILKHIQVVVFVCVAIFIMI